MWGKGSFIHPLTHTCPLTHTHTFTFTCTHTHTHTYTHTHTHTTHSHTHTHTYTHTTHSRAHTAGEDYTTTSQLVTFAPSENSQIVMVPIREDQRVELDENFVGQLTLPSGSSGVVLGAATTATVTIRDDDSEYSETSLKLYRPTLASFPGLHSGSCHLQQGRWKRSSWGGLGCPTFLALFVELSTCVGSVVSV